MRFLELFGLMTVRAHEAAVETLIADRAEALVAEQAERETVARLVGKNANHLTTITCLKQEVEGLRSDVRQAEAAHDKLAAEIATLRPDAEKYRANMRRLKAANDARSAAATARKSEQPAIFS